MFRFSRGEKKVNLWDQGRPVETKSVRKTDVEIAQSDQKAIFELPCASVSKGVFPLQVLFHANETHFHIEGYV